MKKFKETIAVILLITAFLLTLLPSAGCTQLERDGFSPIPQNSPSAWGINPYGEIQN